MNHQEIKDKLFLLRDPESSETDRSIILAHLETCEDCQLSAARWDLFGKALKKVSVTKTSPNFVVRVMDRISSLEESEKIARQQTSFTRWLLPLAGYALALLLMVMAIVHRELPVSTESVLLSDVPQASQWTFATGTPDIGHLFDTQKRGNDL